jgi:hypothetical protein
MSQPILELPITQDQASAGASAKELYLSGSILNSPPTSNITIFYVTSSDAAIYNSGRVAGSYYSMSIQQRAKLESLRTSIEWYAAYSEKFNYKNHFSSSHVAILNIPRVFYGNSIKAGTVSLDFYITGTLAARLQDVNKDGLLIETTGSRSTGSFDEKTAGVVLYNEGFALLTGSWHLADSQDYYNYYTSSTGIVTENSLDYPKWIHWGKSLENVDCTASFGLDFQGQDDVVTISMFTHAGRGELNTSNNPTYLLHASNSLENVLTGGNYFKEYEYQEIKNTIKSNYAETSGSFEKQAFISSIGIYDKDKNLIAIAKLAQPVRKTDSRDYTFKLKLDI